MIKMMNKYIIALAAVAGLTAAGCSSEMPSDDLGGKKYGTLSMQSLVCVTDQDDMSRSTSAEDHLIIDIYRVDKEEVNFISSYKYEGDNKAILLEVGTYTAKAHTEKLEDAQFDAPYYEGELPETFDIYENILTEVKDKITCKLANIKVTIDLTDVPDKVQLTDMKVEVSYNGSILTFEGDNLYSAGYFAASESDASIMIAALTGKINGEKFEHTDVYTENLTAGAHHIIKFSIKTSGVGEDAPEVDENLPEEGEDTPETQD